MRLLKFLEESSEDPFELIWKNCQPFLKTIGVSSPAELEGGDFPKLYRGDSRQFDCKKFTLQMRKPIGTEPEYFDAINKWLKANGYVPRDFAAFTTGNEEHAGSFGYPYVFFPVGNFKYSWVMDEDWNSGPNFDRHAFVWLIRDFLPKNTEAFEDEMQDPLPVDKIKSLQNSDEVVVRSFVQYDGVEWDSVDNWNKRAKKAKEMLGKDRLLTAIGADVEIWFSCRSYYLLDPELFQD